jgi:CBS domain-containing protein
MFASRKDCKTTRYNVLFKRCIMRATSKPLQTLTAGDLMNPDLVCLTQEMALSAAARQLLRNQIGGAPVVDAQGRCVGVLSTVDFLRLAERQTDATRPTSAALPITCSFQATDRTSDGQEMTRCTLPPGVCPLQVKQERPGGEKLIVCSQPHCVLVDWQMVDVEKLPTDEVRRFMTSDPVTALPETSIRVLARMMIDAHVHRVIVVDEERIPIGVVSSMDVMAALANSGGEH